ncbi:MAG: hypothetical protein AAGK25_02015 [Pseudomonadota bacterium]
MDENDFEKITGAATREFVGAQEPGSGALQPSPDKEIRLLESGVERAKLGAQIGSVVRNERLQRALNSVLILALIVFALLTLAFGICWAWHIVMPESSHWLTERQIATVQNFFTGGILASVLSDQFKKYLR